MRIVLALAATLACASTAYAQVDPWVTLEQWVAAIERHEPGQDDSGVRSIAAMPTADFESTFPHMVLLLESLFEGDRARQLDELLEGLAARIDLSPEHQIALKGLVSRARAVGVDRFLKRAAMLHTDVTLLHPHVHLTSRQGTGRLARDGRTVGDSGRPWHWMLARSFLHGVLGANAGDADALLWYRAVGNYFWSDRNFVEVRPHVRRAAALFPGDAEIQFICGLVHESQASSHLQAAVEEEMRTAPRLPGTTYSPSIGSAESERRQARDAFRRALEADPNHQEARLRLARLHTVDGHYDDAAAALTVVLGAVTDPWHRYFAFLFLGRAEEGRGRPDDARAAYARASALFPTAQAPRLAISQIALRQGDRAEAMALFSFLTEGRLHAGEPWGLYDAVRTPDTQRQWLQRLRETFSESTR